MCNAGSKIYVHMSSTVHLHCKSILHPVNVSTLLIILLLFQIPIATSGIRAMGYLMRHHLRTQGGGSISQRIITQFVKVKQEPFQ